MAGQQGPPIWLQGGPMRLCLHSQTCVQVNNADKRGCFEDTLHIEVHLSLCSLMAGQSCAGQPVLMSRFQVQADGIKQDQACNNACIFAACTQCCIEISCARQHSAKLTSVAGSSCNAQQSAVTAQHT